MRPLILASSSPYRRELLQRLRLPFECASPDIDETPLPNEDGRQMVMRLAETKARALASRFPEHLIIGSDQVAINGKRILGKPHTLERAEQQLKDASGAQVSFLTGLALLDSRSGHCQTDCIPFTVHFRELDEARIRRYLDAERPLDCAGSFKAEGLGVSLFKRTDGEDATSLIGLPLIRLVDMLLAQGVQIP